MTSSYVSAVLPALLILGLGFGMIFAPAINTATFGVARRDSGVASVLVNTMQQAGGSIGTSALSTIALSATASCSGSASSSRSSCSHPSAALQSSGGRPTRRKLPLPPRYRLGLPPRGHLPPPPPRPAASLRGDSRSPVQLLAGSDLSSRFARDANPLAPAAGPASRGAHRCAAKSHGLFSVDEHFHAPRD